MTTTSEGVAMNETAYVGRFAPSPTGPLHFGSLLAAVASYLDAKQAGGRWLVRIEDIDPPRETPGADREIVSTLERYGFEWDGPILYQSENEQRHRQLAAELTTRGLAYPCGCSRRDLADQPRGPLGIVYPGTCRAGTRATETALRLLTNATPIRFDDRLQGPQAQSLESESGDFVILRRDTLVAYHLAVVVDDADQGITHVVRGIDLLPSTPRQIHLQRLLGFSQPQYAHIPVVEQSDGSKLSKLTGAAALPNEDVSKVLHAALDALGQAPPAKLTRAPLPNLWRWALERWQTAPLLGRTRIAVQHYC